MDPKTQMDKGVRKIPYFLWVCTVIGNVNMVESYPFNDEGRNGTLMEMVSGTPYKRCEGRGGAVIMIVAFM